MSNSCRFEKQKDHVVYLWLSHWSHIHFRHLKQPEEERQDCAQAFTLTMWPRHAGEVCDCRHGTRPIVWLCRCADNFALNRQRQISREAGFLSLESPDGFSVAFSLPDRRPLPPIYSIRQEARQLLMQALKRLRPEEQELFLRHYIYQETFVELAGEIGHTPDAVRMRVMRASKKMRVFLEIRNFDADGYLAILASPHPTLGMHPIRKINDELD